MAGGVDSQGVCLSRRTAWDLRPNPLTAALAARRERGAPVLDLTQSNPTLAGIEYPAALWEALREADAAVYRPAPLGLATAREAVAVYYGDRGVDVEPGRIALTASTSEAYAFLFKLLADPGDEVLVPRPSYPLFDYLAGLEGVHARSYPLRLGDGRWRLDADRLAAAVTPRSRAVVVVSPNNPTGSFATPAEREAVEGLARECGLAVIADEVFADYPLDARPGRVARFAAGAGVLTFALGGLSKAVGLPQLKLAWTVAGGPEGQVTEALARLEVIADTYLSVATPVQAALPELLALRAPVQACIQHRIARNLAQLRSALAGTAARVLPCEGGWCAVVEGAFDGDDLALRLLSEDGVLLHPGTFYDFPPGGYLVVGLLSADLDAGAPRLALRLRR